VDVHGDRVRKQLSELSPSNQVQVKIQIAAATLEKKDVSALHLLERTSRALAIAARPQDGARAAGVRQVGEAVRSAAPRQDPARLGNNRILWVEDHREFEFGARVRQDLKSLGLQFVFALSTSEALEKLARQKFVAVVSDMVREDGMREGCVLLEAMRRRGDETPFFIYAGLNFPGRERSMKELGGQGCTDDAQELFEMIARVLANR
jgi:CheY-like chemotaxis protein